MPASNPEPESLFEGFWALSLAEREARWFERGEAVEPEAPSRLLIVRLREMHRLAVARSVSRQAR